MATNPDVEIRRLRAALRDLVALWTIPAAWAGREPPAIAAGLADVLVGSLNLDLAFVRLCDPRGGAPVEVTRGDASNGFPESLQRHLTPAGQLSGKEIIRDLGGSDSRHAVVIPVGVNAEGGVVAAVSARTDFPTEVDQLLVSVAANNAATAFQSARVQQELRQARNGLEIEVAERTAELRRATGYLARAQRLSQTGSFGWNVSSGELYWSDETFRIFQFDPATTPTLECLFQRVQPDDASIVRQTLERASKEGEDFDIEHRLLMPDGSVKYVHVVARGIGDESGGLEFVGAVMDVTAAKRAEARIREAERKLRFLIEAIPAFIVSCLPDGTIDFVSQSWLEYTGCSRESLLNGGWKQVIHPDDLDGIAQTWRAALAAGAPFETEGRSRRADGTYRWFLQRAVPLRADNGEIVKWFGTLHDIEDRRRVEEALRQAQADLAHVSRVTTLGEMAASIAHEVDQPLSGVVINANACLRFLAGASPNLDEVRDGLQAIARDGRRAADVIARIRSLARRTGTEKEPLDMNEVIGDVVALAEREARRTGAKVRTELTRNLPRVNGDRVQLQQVVLNLLLNGLEAMHAVPRRPRDLVISTRPEARDRVLVTVQDSGSGIDPQLAPRMFDAFYTTKPGGMGMGLSISRTIVEQHGGRLWAVPNDGPGATFLFIV
jgi:PAS domain S-box-containing protein